MNSGGPMTDDDRGPEGLSIVCRYWGTSTPLTCDGTKALFTYCEQTITTVVHAVWRGQGYSG